MSEKLPVGTIPETAKRHIALRDLITIAHAKLAQVEQPTNPQAPRGLQEWKYIGQVPNTLEVVIIRCQGDRVANQRSGLFVEVCDLNRAISPKLKVQLPKQRHLTHLSLMMPDIYSSAQIREVVDKIKNAISLSEEGYQDLLFTAMSPVS